jgi:hypothetical protein
LFEQPFGSAVGGCTLSRKEYSWVIPKLKWFNLALRALMELGIVVGLGYWGYVTGGSLGTRLLLAIGAPLLGFGFWGMVDFRQAGKFAEPLRLIQELVISGLAAAAWYGSGQHSLGISLGLVSLVYHVLVYTLGGTLLKQS